ncbi:MAG: preprotein translocase subunit SecE [Pseudohongiellaceae bacterium]|nr:preprotein translocase subunit SecE [Pseudohongiellaceae bacterium]
MSEKFSEQGSQLDWLKWLAVVAIVAAGVYANSYFAAESILYRTIGLLVLAGVAGWIAVQTAKGGAFLNLILEARAEIRRVVWPTRQETTQTTIIVLIVVFVIALLLWLLDWGLNEIVSGIIG